MEKLREYIFKNFEQIFVLLILVSIVLINYYLPQKLAFLNFYYIPVLAAGYILGRRSALLGSCLCFLMVAIYAYLNPELFFMEENMLDLALSILTWGSFLILAGILVGTMYEKLTNQIDETKQLNEKLQEQQQELETANIHLKDYTDNLEEKVTARTEELEKTNRTIERLKQKMEETLYSTMDSDVVHLMIKGQLRNEKRRISVLFSDLTDFTTYSDDHRPEVVIDELNRFLGEMEPILMKYRGHIDKYIGDGIMCEFGAPMDYETHSLMAVLAGIKMQEKFARLSFPWKMRLGIGSGPTITGLIGSKRQTYTAIGDVVNLASRLEGACQPGKILIDEETYQAIDPFIETVRIRSFRAKRTEDLELEKKMEEYQEILKTDPEEIQTLFEIGKIHYQLREVSKAIQYFEKVLALEPDNLEVKLAYAEANINRDKYEKIEIKGKKKRVSVYEVVSIRDVMMDRNKIPEKFYEKYRSVEDLIDIPEDVALSVEALDGSIGHSKVTAILSYAIADQLGLPDKDKHDIMIAGYLCDVGKEIIPHQVLNRTGRLNENEFKEVEKHPFEGTRVLRNIGIESEKILDIILHHHEMYNGEGYPLGKKGEEIPLGARIVAVADTYDALTSWRPYRERWERSATLYEVNRGVEKGMFDPQIVRTLTELMNSG